MSRLLAVVFLGLGLLSLMACGSGEGEGETGPVEPVAEAPAEASPAPSFEPIVHFAATPLPTLEALPETVSMENDSPPSPDGGWLLRHRVYDVVQTRDLSEGYQQSWVYHSRHLVAIDGSITHTIQAEWIADGVGGSWPQFLGWAPDSSVAYVYLSGGADGCAMNDSSQSIQRVSTADGALTGLEDVGGTPSLSPDGRRIAGVRSLGNGQLKLAWIDTAGGIPGSLSLTIPPGADAARLGEPGPPRWSPDAESLVITFHYAACDAEDWRNRLLFVDLASGESQVIWEPSEALGRATLLGWEADDGLELRLGPAGYESAPEESEILRVDARTGELR